MLTKFATPHKKLKKVINMTKVVKLTDNNSATSFCLISKISLLSLKFLIIILVSPDNIIPLTWAIIIFLGEIDYFFLNLLII